MIKWQTYVCLSLIRPIAYVNLFACRLILINMLRLDAVLQLLGAVLLALGLFLKFGQDKLTSWSLIADSIPDLSKYESGDDVTGAPPSANISAILDAAAIPLIVVGCILFVITICGCLGGCCHIKWMLIVVCSSCDVVALHNSTSLSSHCTVCHCRV